MAGNGSAGGYHLGVDLGTTFTAAAVADGQPPTVLGLGNRAMQVPSVLFLQPDGKFLVGEAAERRGTVDPSRVAREFKRRMGDHVPLIVAGQPHSAQSLTAHLLRWVVAVATERMGEPPSRITVTHPANWGTYRHELLEQAIALAGIGEAQTCPEPTAAAVQYAAQTRVPVGARIAVYDLGGGTFDVCILEKVEDGFVILGAPQGLEQLGGIDFDEVLFRKVLHDLGDSAARLDSDDPATMTGLVRLRRDCVEAKESLSADVDTLVPVALPGINTSVRVNRSELEALIRPSLSQTVGAMGRALRSAGVDSGDLHAIVLIGGSSRIPLVTQLLRAAFDAPTALDIHPKHDIALGAVQSNVHRLGLGARKPRGVAEKVERNAPSRAAPVWSPPESQMTTQPLLEVAPGILEEAPALSTRILRREVTTAADAPTAAGAPTAPTPPHVKQPQTTSRRRVRTRAGPALSRRSLHLVPVVAAVAAAAVVSGVLLATRAEQPQPSVLPALTTSTPAPTMSTPVFAPRWTPLAPLPMALRDAAVAVFRGRIWVAGGSRSDAPGSQVDRVFIYDPVTDAWSNGPSLGRPTSNAALVAAGDALMFMGGYVESGGSREVLTLSADGRGWTQVAPLPQNRVSGAAAYDGHRVVFAGGTRPDQTAADEIWSYEGDQWSQVGQLGHGRANFAAVSNGSGTVWFLGGYDKETKTGFSDIDVIVGGLRTPTATRLTTATFSGAATHTQGGVTCLIGGKTQIGYAAWWCDDAPFATSLPAPAPRRAGLGAALLGETIYVIGGYDDKSTSLDSVEAVTVKSTWLRRPIR